MSTDRPILMAGPLVVATLEGRKTQTRRIVTAANSRIVNAGDVAGTSERDAWAMADLASARPGTTGPHILAPDRTAGKGWSWLIESRINVGDRMWPREAWRTAGMYNTRAPSKIPTGAPIRYEADSATANTDGTPWWGRLRPSMFMPRWASRAVLVVDDVRPERVWAISEDDARAEGVPYVYGDSPRDLFAALWDEINGKRPGCSWADNPWVWSITYHVEKST